jgi:single-strand DNA-binding protein
MSGLNTAFLLGRLRVPPEELTTESGKLFLKAVIATFVHQKNSDGVSEERISFIPVTVFGRTAEIFRQYVHKGDMVHLVGSLTSNEWTTGLGEKRLSLSFVIEQLNLLPNERAQAQQKPEQKQNMKRPERSQTPEPLKPQPNLNKYGEPNDIPF